MKTTRKILPALVMLLVSAIMLSTASYAWFASNSQVKASNMHVKVKANTKFLEIALDAGATDYGAGVTFNDAGLPEIGGYELVHAKFDEAEDPASLGWYVGTNSDRTHADDADTTLSQLVFNETIKLERYALKRTAFVRMSPSSDTPLDNLRIDKTTTKIALATSGSEITDTLAPALRILAVATQVNGGAVLGAQIYDPYADKIETYNKKAATDYLVPTVVLGEVYQVDIYIYYDGTDEVAFTDNIKTLQELVVDVGFVAGAEVANP